MFLWEDCFKGITVVKFWYGSIVDTVRCGKFGKVAGNLTAPPPFLPPIVQFSNNLLMRSLDNGSRICYLSVFEGWQVQNDGGEGLVRKTG